MSSFKGFIIGKGLARFTGHIMADRHLISKKVLIEKRTIPTRTGAAAIAYTPANLLAGLILRDTDLAGAGVADTLPSAADLVEALGDQAFIGASFEFTIRNYGAGGQTITVTQDAGASFTVSGTATIVLNDSKRFLVVITAVTTPAAVAYSLGTVTH